MKPSLAGVVLLTASLASYITFTRPLRTEADALRAEYSRVRRALARQGSEARIRTERLALWKRAVEAAAASGSGSNPMLVLRKRVLAAAARAGRGFILGRWVGISGRGWPGPAGCHLHRARRASRCHPGRGLRSGARRSAGSSPGAGGSDTARVGPVDVVVVAVKAYDNAEAYR